MISLDVSSLFTNVALNFILNGIEKRWHYIHESTELPLEEFKNGIEILMNSTFFKFDNTYYKHFFRCHLY